MGRLSCHLNSAASQVQHSTPSLLIVPSHLPSAHPAEALAASCDDLLVCPGIGQKKVRRLHAAFSKPFLAPPLAAAPPPPAIDVHVIDDRVPVEEEEEGSRGPEPQPGPEDSGLGR
jgi:hypothetical protein